MGKDKIERGTNLITDMVIDSPKIVLLGDILGYKNNLVIGKAGEGKN